MPPLVRVLPAPPSRFLHPCSSCLSPSSVPLSLLFSPVSHLHRLLHFFLLASVTHSSSPSRSQPRGSRVACSSGFPLSVSSVVEVGFLLICAFPISRTCCSIDLRQIWLTSVLSPHIFSAACRRGLVMSIPSRGFPSLSSGYLWGLSSIDI